MDDRTPRPYASSDEDFEMVPDAVNGTKDTLTLTAAAELSHVATTNARATVACNITAAASEGKRRPDVDVVVVMDRSGSMEAERKLELCKETTELLIEQLRPTDRFGLVSFDHRVKTNTNLVSATSDVTRAVKSLASTVRGGLISVRFRAEPSGATPVDPRTPTAGASFPPPAPAPRQGLFSSLFRKSQAPLEDQDLEE